MATIKKDFIVKNGLQVGGNILPDEDVSYDLGSTSNKFRDLYLSGSTITLGTIKIKDNGDGTLGVFDSDGSTPASVVVNSVDVDYNNSVSGLTAENVKAALDELQANIENIDTAGEISYNNSSSGLTAETIQAAIDELDATLDTLSTDAIDTVYDNATSGLSSTNVQDALDELDSALDNLSSAAADITYDNSSSGLSATFVKGALDELASEKADNGTSLSDYGILDAYTKSEVDSDNSDIYSTISSENDTLHSTITSEQDSDHTALHTLITSEQDSDHTALHSLITSEQDSDHDALHTLITSEQDSDHDALHTLISGEQDTIHDTLHSTITSEQDSDHTALHALITSEQDSDHTALYATITSDQNTLHSTITSEQDSDHTALYNSIVSGGVELTNIDKIDFDTTSPGTPVVGGIAWNTNDKTLDLKVSDEVTLQVGQEHHVRVKNTSGTTILNGTVVMVTGADDINGVPEVSAFDGSQDNANATLGIATEQISNNTIGFVTTFGKVRGISTNGSSVGETWLTGDILYATPNSSTGSLTKVVPSDDEVMMPVAFVIESDPDDGILMVRFYGIDNNHEIIHINDLDSDLSASISNLSDNVDSDISVLSSTKVDKITPITGDTVGSSTAIPIITYNTQGQITSASETAITVGDGTITLTAGSGMSGGGDFTTNQSGSEEITISHADTSSQSSVDNTNGTLIQDIALDTYGHITSISSLDGDARWVNKTGDTIAGDLEISSAMPKLKLTDTDNNSDYSLRNANGEFQVYDETNTSARMVISSSGQTTFADSVIIDGDLSVNGTFTTVDVETLAVTDTFIYLNEGDSTGNNDLGWAGSYNDGTYAHTGMFRDATDGYFKVFKGYTPEPTGTIDTSHGTYEAADLVAANFRGNLIGDVTGTASTATTLTGLTSTVAELNKLDGYTGGVTELNYLDALHATGVTSTEFDYLDGVTSNIQTQLNAKVINNATLTVQGTGVLGGSGTFTSNASSNNTVSITHDTSGVTANTYGSGTAIPVITVNDTGHVTGMTTASVNTYDGWALTVAGTDRGTISENERVSINAGSNVSLGYSATNNTITINSSYTNTTYSAGSGITLAGTTFSHTDTSTQASVNNSNGTVIQDITLDTYGHITGIGSKTLTAADVGAVSTSGTAYDAARLDGQLPSYYRINVYNNAGTLLN